MHYFDIVSCDGENTRDPKATGANVSSVLISDSHHRFLPSFVRDLMLKTCGRLRNKSLPATDCLRANPHASAMLMLIALKLLTYSSELVIFA